MKALFGADELATKILSGGATGCLGACLANPIAPWDVFQDALELFKAKRVHLCIRIWCA